MITDAIGNPESKTDNASEPNCIGIRNPIDNADRIGAIGSVPLAIDNADSASDADPRSDSATIPRQQTTFNEQHQEGYVSREPHQSATLGREPPQRCPVHADDPHPPPCNGCAEARRTHNAWQRANTEALKAEAAQLRIAGRTCSMCDGRWRYPPPELLAVNPDPPVVKCDHVTPTTLDHWHLSEDTPRDPSRPHRATTGP